MARAFNQAEKFGAEMAIPDEVVRLQCFHSDDGARFQPHLANGDLGAGTVTRNADPVSFWQSVQLQTPTVLGSTVAA